MVRVSRGGPVGCRRSGGAPDLARLADDVGANETCAVTDILRRAILAASEIVGLEIGRELPQR